MSFFIVENCMILQTDRQSSIDDRFGWQGIVKVQAGYFVQPQNFEPVFE